MHATQMENANKNTFHTKMFKMESENHLKIRLKQGRVKYMEILQLLQRMNHRIQNPINESTI